MKDKITNVCGATWIGVLNYSTADLYKQLHRVQHPRQQVDWWKDVWDQHTIPKHSFIGWLAMHKRLQTRDRMLAMNIITDDTCLLCGDRQEDHGHLFFGCPFSRQCLKEVKEWLGIHTTSNTLDQLLWWIKRRYKGSKIRKQIIRASIFCYCILHMARKELCILEHAYTYCRENS